VEEESRAFAAEELRARGRAVWQAEGEGWDVEVETQTAWA